MHSPASLAQGILTTEPHRDQKCLTFLFTCVFWGMVQPFISFSELPRFKTG